MDLAMNGEIHDKM